MPDGGLATIGDIIDAKKAAAEPEQIWSCGDPAHRHIAKAEAVKCLEDGAAKAAAASSSEGATAPEGDPGAETPAEVEDAAPEPPAEAQSALEMARAAIERGEAVLARAGATTEEAEPTVDTESTESTESTENTDQAAEPAEKAGDAPGDGSKPYGDETYADNGLRADGKKRYPLTKDGKPSEEQIRAAWNYISHPANCAAYGSGDCAKVKAKIVSAWKEHIDSAGPPSASEKASGDLTDLLNALVAMPDAKAALITLLQKTITDATPLETLVSDSDIEKGARHGATDQVHLDNAAYCCSKAMGTRSASKAEKMDIHDAHQKLIDAGATSIAAPASHSAPANATQDTADKAVLDSGATSIAAPPLRPAPPNATQDTGRNAEISAPQSSAGKVPASPMPKASDQQLLEDATQKIGELIAIVSKAGGSQSEIIELLAAAEAMTKAAMPPHHILMDMAHKCLKAFSSGSTCKADMPDPERHGVEDMTRVHAAHYHIGKVGGGNCVPGGEPMAHGEREGQGAMMSAGKAAGTPQEWQPDTDALAKANNDLAAKIAENAELVKTVNTIVPMLTKLQEHVTILQGDVKQIAATPIPPMAMVRGGTPTTKAADNGSIHAQSGSSQGDIATVLDNASDEEVTLALIKRSQRRPMSAPLSLVSSSQLRDRAPAR